MKNKIRLLLVSSVFVDRGAERIMLWLYQMLPKERYQVRMSCLRNLSPFAQRLRESGQEVVDVIGMRHQLDVPALVRLYNYLCEYRPDVLHIHSLRAAIWGRPIAKMAGVPVVLYSVHNRWGGRIHYALDRWSSRFGDAVIPFSQAVRDYLICEVGISPARIRQPVYIGIDLKRFAPINRAKLEQARENLGISPGDQVIGFVGALSEQKGLTFLLEAVSRLRSESGYGRLKCLLIGEGPLEPELKSQADNFKLNGIVHFLGQRYDVALLLQLMDVFVLPSLWEGLPQVVLEAMASKVPVVATAVDGTPEVITHKVNGWLIPPKNVDTLVYGIRCLLEDQSLRVALANNAYATVAERFTVKRMVADFDQLYQNYLAKTRS